MFLLKGVFSTDIITNSSSVVYSRATSVESLHEFINEILSMFGVSKKSEDVFDILIIPDDLKYTDEHIDEYDFYELFGFDKKSFEKLSWSERYNLTEKRGLELAIEGKLELSLFEDEYGYMDSSYLVRQKDGTDTNIGKMLEGLFSHDAIYN